MDQQTLLSKIKRWDKAYAAGNPIVSDAFYDKMRDKLRIPYDTLNSTYSPGKKVKLPRTMGSLKKVRPANIDSFVKHKDSYYTFSPKFDGQAVKLVYVKGRLKKAYSRGDGVIGRNVLHIVKHINGVFPKISKFTGEINGEVIVHKTLFKKHFQKLEYKHPRNLVTGLLNQKEPSESILRSLRYLTFIAYEAFNEEKKYLAKTAQVGFLYNEGIPNLLNPSRWSEKTYDIIHSGKKFTSIDIQIPTLSMGTTTFIGKAITSELATGILKEWRESLDIVIDGIVLEYEAEKLRKKLGYDGLNPKFAVAIKPDPVDQITKLGKLKSVNYDITGRRIYKPVAELKDPLNFDGVEVTNITLHNAKFVVKNKIGAGSVLKIIRSGDVIPRCMGNTVKKEPQIPSKCYYCNSKLKWTETKTDLYCPNVSCNGFLTQKTVGFFQRIKVDGLAKTSIIKLIKDGYDTPAKILHLNSKQLGKSGIAVPAKIEARLKKCKPTIPEIMWASNIFSNYTVGIGVTRAKAIYKELGSSFLEGPINSALRFKLLQIPGVSNAIADVVYDNLQDFRLFYKSLNVKVTELKDGPLTGMVAAFTNYRDPKQEKFITENGGDVSAGMTKKVTVLFAANLASTKAQKAQQNGIEIIKKEKAWEYLKGKAKK